MDQEFEFDPAKSAANRDKHGIDFVEAQQLWAVYGWEQLLPFPREPRWLRVAISGGRVWTAIYTWRGDRIRLISVRRARIEEEASHERAVRTETSDGPQP